MPDPLPNSIEHVNCAHNKLTSLPSLNSLINYDNLKRFDYSGNEGLPNNDAIPNSICSDVSVSDQQNSSCSQNLFIEVLKDKYPDLLSEDGNLDKDRAAEIKHLDLSFSELTDINLISHFTNLTEFNCSHNLLKSLPDDLPVGLTIFNCSDNQLSTLPVSLPIQLKDFNCSDNELEHLPNLQSLQSLTHFHCSDNKLDELNTLPNGLVKLHCSTNNLTILPVLPEGLTDLHCSYNQLTSLPEQLPQTLDHINCAHNKLTSLHNLPEGLNRLDCSYNPLFHADGGIVYSTVNDNKIFYQNGDTYLGQWNEDKKRDGSGKMTYHNGVVYEGNFTNDQPCGDSQSNGILTISGIDYKNICTSDELYFYDIEESAYPSGTVIFKPEKNQEGINSTKIILSNVAVYEGEVHFDNEYWENIMPEGLGKLTSTDIINTGELHWELNESSVSHRTNSSTIIYDNNGRIYDGTVNENKQPYTN